MRPWNAPMGVPTGGRRWLRWLALAVFVVALAIAFVNLGFWQLARLDQRRAANDSVAAHESSPPVAFESVFNHTITDSDQWLRVTVRGTFDPEHQFLVRYRSNAGQTGYEIVTPLRTTTGETVLVDRGFAARPADQDYPAVLPQPPVGEVSIVGYVRRNEQGRQQSLTPLPPNNSISLINSEALASSLPYPIVNGFVSIQEIDVTQGGGLQPVQPPELTEGNHFSYALQWFAFAAIAGVGLVLMIRSDLRAGPPPDRRPRAEENE